MVPGNFWPGTGAEYMSHILRLMHRSDIPLSFGAQAPLITHARYDQKGNQESNIWAHFRRIRQNIPDRQRRLIF